MEIVGALRIHGRVRKDVSAVAMELLKAESAISMMTAFLIALLMTQETRLGPGKRLLRSKSLLHAQLFSGMLVNVYILTQEESHG
jgi:hypothetical protein